MAYRDAFIVTSEDCPVTEGAAPPPGKKARTKAEIEYALLTEAPYSLTQDALNYAIHCEQNAAKNEPPQNEATFLSKGHPCLRASALIKRYGWGAHYNEQGRIALYSAGGADYARLSSADSGLKTLKGMRSKRA